MNINNFENYVEERALAKGNDYYKNGHVLSLKRIEENEYEAEVKGQQLYTVEVELDHQGNIMETVCDCSYDLGGYCKHQIAVFFALKGQWDKDELTNNIQVTPYAPFAGQPMTLEEILFSRDKDELVGFILELADKYEDVMQRIEWDFASQGDEAELETAQKWMHSYVDNYVDYDGYMNNHNAVEASECGDLVLKKAGLALQQNKKLHALNLALCVVQGMMSLLEDSDDSLGLVGNTIETCFVFIDEIIQSGELKYSERKRLFSKLEQEASQNIYKNWIDWRLKLLDQCSQLANAEDLRKRLEQILSNLAKAPLDYSWNEHYFMERINLIRYRLILNHRGVEKEQAFIQANLCYDSFRRIAIDHAMELEDYDDVITLAAEALEMAEELSGSPFEWEVYQYKAFKLSKNVDAQRKLAKKLALDGSFEYYKELKNTYELADWVNIYPDIILKLEEQKRKNYYIYTQILIAENEKQKLLNYISENPYSVEFLYTYVVPEFEKGIYDIFQQYILQTAKEARDRKAYSGVCRIIQSLKNAGGYGAAAAVKEKLLNQYTNKPAFKDELSKV